MSGSPELEPRPADTSDTASIRVGAPPAQGWRQRLAWSLADIGAMLRLHARVLTRPLFPVAYAEGDPELPVVLLIPGVYERWWFLDRFARALHAEGYRIAAVRGLRYNTEPIIDTADRLAAALHRNPVPSAGRVLLTHSKGGLIAKKLLIEHGPALGLRGVVALAAPFAGSRHARYVLDPRLRAFRPEDLTIRALGDDDTVNPSITSIHGRYDTHIPEGSRLDGGVNVQVDATGHFTILLDDDAVRAVVEAVRTLDPDPAPPVVGPAPHPEEDA